MKTVLETFGPLGPSLRDIQQEIRTVIGWAEPYNSATEANIERLTLILETLDKTLVEHDWDALRG